jgi:glycosyltransferase involved in cell wall biosynthesis
VQIHQILAGAAMGDAITRIALTTRTVLRRYGGSEIYAHHIDPSVEGAVLPLSDLRPGTADDVLIVRASIGDTAIGELLETRPERIVVAYHNITPARFFEGIDPVFADLLRLGRHQLTAWAPRVTAAFADSRFNADDLEALGYRDVEVVPPLLDPFHLLGHEPDQSFALEVRRRAPAELVLFVGQMLPHKRPHLLIAAHHLFVSHHFPDATLVLVGAHRSPDYAAALARFAGSLGLPRVWFTGAVSDRELAELYRYADVFVTASSHEGFCVPLVEAMAHSVPVVASPSGAIPETAGGAAMMVPGDRAEHFAESTALVLRSPQRAEMVLAGRRRARQLSLAAAEDRLVSFLERHL